jgi:hypothetical protein
VAVAVVAVAPDMVEPEFLPQLKPAPQPDPTVKSEVLAEMVQQPATVELLSFMAVAAAVLAQQPLRRAPAGTAPTAA